jgi:hypothetical protein
MQDVWALGIGKMEICVGNGWSGDDSIPED